MFRKAPYDFGVYQNVWETLLFQCFLLFHGDYLYLYLYHHLSLSISISIPISIYLYICIYLTWGSCSSADSEALWWSLRFCISFKLSGEAAVGSGLRSTVWIAKRRYQSPRENPGRAWNGCKMQWGVGSWEELYLLFSSVVSVGNLASCRITWDKQAGSYGILDPTLDFLNQNLQRRVLGFGIFKISTPNDLFH